MLLCGVDKQANGGCIKQFYSSTQGDKWNKNSSWLVGNSCVDDWFGVCCNNAGQVTELKLPSNSLNTKL